MRPLHSRYIARWSMCPISPTHACRRNKSRACRIHQVQHIVSGEVNDMARRRIDDGRCDAQVQEGQRSHTGRMTERHRVGRGIPGRRFRSDGKHCRPGARLWSPRNSPVADIVIPVQIPFTSSACRKVPSTGPIAALNVTETVTVMVAAGY